MVLTVMLHRKEIDGLRAVALLPVILYHAGFASFGGGYLGVDVFFVISGYLITSLILEEHAAGRFSLAGFYARRARRILPALFAVILVCLPFAYFWMLSFELKEFSQSVVAVVSFLSNVFFWRTTDYFGALAEVKPLLHTWSLGVEEQFYLLFPLVLLAALRFGRRFALAATIIAAAVSLGAAHWAADRMPIASFYLLPTRAWELLAGSVCGFVMAGRVQRSQGGLAAVGLGMIVVPVFLFDAETSFLGGFAVVPVLGTALVILFAASGTVVARLLSAGPVAGLGLISYSAYLWHQPVFAFLRIRSPETQSPVVLGVLVFVIFGLAYVTWRWVETPFRGKTPVLASGRALIAVTVAVGGLLAAAGYAGVAANGFDQRSNGDVTMGALAATIAPNPGLGGCDTVPPVNAVCSTGPDPKILLWGDSFAKHLAQGIKASAGGRAFVQITMSQCAPILDIAQKKDWLSGNSADTCIAFNQSVLDYIRSERIEVVIMGSALGLASWRVTRRNGEIVEGDSPAIVARGLAATVAAIRAAGAKVVFVSPTPSSGQDSARCAIRSIFDHKNAATCDFPLQTARLEYDLLRSVEGEVPVYWLYRDMCRDGICKAREGDVSIYRDEGHLSIEGSRMIGERAGWIQALLRMAR